MKKTLLLAAASLLTYTAAFAQNGKQMLETIEETNIGDNMIFYYYNSDELVDSIVAVDYYGTTSKAFTYNDDNQVERIDCYSYNSFEFEKYMAQFGVTGKRCALYGENSYAATADRHPRAEQKIVLDPTGLHANEISTAEVLAKLEAEVKERLGAK